MGVHGIIETYRLRSPTTIHFTKTNIQMLFHLPRAAGLHGEKLIVVENVEQGGQVGLGLADDGVCNLGAVRVLCQASAAAILDLSC